MTSSMSSQKLRGKLWQKILSYCKHSTMHGMYYFYKCRTFSMRATWLIIVGCCVALSCFLNLKIWDQYVIDPTVTVVESTHYPTSNIAFPAIVLCDSSQVYGPITDPVSNILLRRGYELPDIELFFETLASLDALTPLLYQRMVTIHDLLEDIGIPLEDLLDMLDKPCDVLIKQCIWRSEEHNCSKMFRKVLTFRGFCCRFDLDYFRAHATNGTNFVAQASTNEALQLVIDGRKFYPNGSIVEAAAELFLFDKLDHITPLDSSVSLASKFFFDVSVQLSATHASQDVKALQRNVRRCTLPSDAKGSSFYSGCVAEVMINEITRHCKCMPFSSINGIGKSEGYEKCTWQRHKCVTQTRQTFSGGPAELVAFQTCFQKCDYVKYDSQVQFFELNRPLFNKEKSLQEEGFSEVAIHFADRTCMKYRREVLFTWDQMLANIGGIYGLCMGGSIISIIELIWLLLDLIYICVADRLLRVDLPFKKNKINDNIFVVSNRKSENVHTKNSTKKIQSGKLYPFTH